MRGYWPQTAKFMVQVVSVSNPTGNMDHEFNSLCYILWPHIYFMLCLCSGTRESLFEGGLNRRGLLLSIPVCIALDSRWVGDNNIQVCINLCLELEDVLPQFPCLHNLQPLTILVHQHGL